MRQKLAIIAIPAVLGMLCLLDIVDGHNLVMYVRHFFYRGKGVVAQLGSRPPVRNVQHAYVCRENLSRIQNAKRKAAFDRGRAVGYVTWAEVVEAMYPNEARRGLTPARLNLLLPRCPSRGNYYLGSLEELSRCSVMGNETLPVDDDHIIRN